MLIRVQISHRRLGGTGLTVSSRGFGAWAIGGASYGAVAMDVALDALARAEELGCNFVDTAAVFSLVNKPITVCYPVPVFVRVTEL